MGENSPLICAWHWISSSNPQSLVCERRMQHARVAEKRGKTNVSMNIRMENMLWKKAPTDLCHWRHQVRGGKNNILTQIHGCFRASLAVILLVGLTVSIWLMRFFASGVTVSHSGVGYCGKGRGIMSIINSTVHAHLCFFTTCELSFYYSSLPTCCVKKKQLLFVCMYVGWDLHRRSRILSVHITGAGPRPRMGGNRLVGYKVWLRRPICPRACRRAPFSGPRGSGSPAFPRNLWPRRRIFVVSVLYFLFQWIASCFQLFWICASYAVMELNDSWFS